MSPPDSAQQEKSSSAKFFVLAAVLVVGAISVIATLVLSVGANSTRSAITEPSQSAQVFTRTVFDMEQSSHLESLPQTLLFAGPLLRPEGEPIELVEMTPGLNVLGVREVDGGFFYSSATTGRNEVTFIGGGCNDSSGAWASCAEVGTLTPNGQDAIANTKELELDFHEFEPDGAGGYWAIKYSRVTCESATQKHCQTKPDGTVVEYVGDCNIVRVVDGEVAYSWSAYEVLPDGESTSARYDEFSDVFHCNSIEFYKEGTTEKVLLSMRNTDSIYQVDLKSGQVDWKLGGSNWPGVSLAVENFGTIGASRENDNPADVLSGQHDARYWGEGIYSVFDNGSRTGRAARGLVFSVDKLSKTALIRQVFTDPAGNPSACTGSFRKLADEPYWVAGWGCSSSGITVFDSNTSPIVSVDLDQEAPENLQRTVASSGALRWALSYRVTVE